ncbi:MAG TPA: DUF4157 domain-containing protein [Chitinophagaceae bacterium]
MFSSAEKTNHFTPVVQQKTAGPSFFRKAGEESFFSTKETPSFFGSYIQPKLTVSSPDDPQEKEADEVAEHVMRMPGPAMPIREEKEEKLQRDPASAEAMADREIKEEKKEEEKIQPKLTTPAINIHRKCEACEKEEAQAKLFRMIQCSEDAFSSVDVAEEETTADRKINRKHISLHHSDIIQRSGRGPPGGFTQFEQSLTSTKGQGSALPTSTQQFMESRFNADFSGIRVHTGSYAENLSSNIHAQAFTYGHDIYFNNGKYSPNTADGSLLLAHELTHTIQQGASQSKKQSSNTLTRKHIIQRLSGNSALSQQLQDLPPATGTGLHKPLLTQNPLRGDNRVGDQRPRTLRELRKDMFNINRKPGDRTEDEIAQEQNPVEAKTELSTWNVDAGGHLQTASHHTVNKNENKVQAKEEEKKEEEEKLGLVNTSSVQKKETCDIHCKDESGYNVEMNVQNKPIVQLKTENEDSSLNIYNDAETSEQTVEQDRGPPAVQAKYNFGETVQRSVIDDALAFAGDVTDCITIDLDEAKSCALQKAQQVALHIPGYKALRVVLGQDPITGENVERNGRNFIEAALEIMPGGFLLRQKLDELQLLDAAAAWIDGKIAEVELLVSSLFRSIESFWNGLGVSDFTSPMDVLRRGADIVFGFIDEVVDFAVNTAGELLKMVKDFLLGKIVDFIKEQTPVYPLLTVILGKDPITEQPVERNGTNILNALLELGGEEGVQQRTQMQQTGTFQKVAGYIDEGIAVFSGAYEQIVLGFHNIWNAVSIESLMNPVGTFLMIYNEFAEPVRKVWAFVREVGAAILRFIKEVLMGRLSAWARTVRGYHVLTLIIGQDPFTGVPVPFNVENVIHAFMSLMEGGEEQFNQMKETGAIAKTTAQIEAAVAKLNMTPAAIIQLYIDLWTSFGLSDLADPIGAFRRIINTFGEPILRLIAFVAEIIRIVIYVILQIMNFPFDVVNNIITRSMEAFGKIKSDPIGFLKNILRAIKQGFIQFFDNIATHLLNGLTGWLLGELKDANVQAPTDFSLGGIISWVLEILGISMEKIWEKLAAHPRIGPQRVEQIKGVITKLEGIWTFIKDVQERGITAIWDKIKEQLSNLWSVVLEAITKWVMEKIIINVTIYLLGLLDPTFIMSIVNSVIFIYRAIQSFRRYAMQMLNVVNSFVNGVADIAAGNITTAANYLENTMDKAMPIVIGFLADLIGLGGVGKKVGEMIESVREMVDKALTWLVNKAVDTGFAVLDKIVSVGKAAVGAVRSFLGLEETYTNEAGETHILAIENVNGQAQVKRASGTPEHISIFLSNATTRINDPANSMSEEKKAEIRTAIAEATDIVNSIQGISYPENAPAESQKHIQQQMNQLLSGLKRRVQIIDKSASPVPPVSVVPGFSSNLATNLEVQYLLKGHHQPGTPAEDYEGDMHGAIPILETVGLRPLKWVNFHLLNDGYGGLAVDSNLVPTPKSVNNNYKDTFEESFKGLYNNPTSPEVMWFSCSISYRDDNIFAQSISSRGGAMKADGRNWVPDKAKNITPWSKPVPPPVAESIAINRLPGTQKLIEGVARYTPLSAALLVLLSKIKPTVVTAKSTLLSVLANHARSGAINEAKHNEYIEQINQTTFDFSR